MTVEQALLARLEALLFAAGEPVPLDRLAEVLGADPRTVRHLLNDLGRQFEADRRGIQLVEVAGGFQLTTRPEYHELVARLLARPERSHLSRAALETLAVIAYRQPVTRAEIDSVRGVQSDRAIETLLERNLVREAGRREAPGRPILYETTRDFLLRFGLPDLTALPPLPDPSEAEPEPPRALFESRG